MSLSRQERARAELAKRRGMAMQDDQQQQPQQQEQQEQGGILHSLANSAPVNAALGLGDAPAKLMMGLTGHQFKPAGEGMAYEGGNLAGNIGLWMLLSRVGAGGLAKLGAGGTAATASAPAMGNIANLAKSLAGAGKIPSAIRGITTGAGMGAAENPEDRGMGALEGGALAAGAEAVSPLLAGGKKLLDYTNVKKYANSIYDKLGGGQTLQGNAKNFATQVRDTANGLKKKYTNTVKPIFEKFEDKNDFPTDFWRAMKEEDPKWNGEVISSGVKQKIEKLLKDRNITTAHGLQKQLGDEMADIRLKIHRSQHNDNDVERLKLYSDWYGDTKDTIKEYLEKRDPEAANKWTKSSDFWRDRISPFQADPTLSEIAKGKIKNPGGFHTIFKDPEEQMDYVIRKLGETGKKRIAFSHLGTQKELLEPESLRKGLLGMEGPSGLESSMPKGTKELADELKKRIKANDISRLFIPQLRRTWFRI